MSFGPRHRHCVQPPKAPKPPDLVVGSCCTKRLLPPSDHVCSGQSGRFALVSHAAAVKHKEGVHAAGDHALVCGPLQLRSPDGSVDLQPTTHLQGPPGTGKTRTLLALIALVCGVAQSEGATFAADFGPVLATAGTNAAADNLLEGLALVLTLSP